MADTYRTLKDQLVDRDLLDVWHLRLDVSPGCMQMDECRLWTLRGKRGYVSTWDDGTSIMIYAAAHSPLAWTWAKRRLGFCALTQDGDDEGVFRLTSSPTSDQKAEIRQVVGLRKDISDEYRAELAEMARWRFAGKEPSAADGLQDRSVEGACSQVPEPVR